MGTTNGAGNINAFGASFGAETRDDEKLACITLFLDGVTGDVKDWVADRLGAAIISLNKLEEKLPAVLDEIAAEKANVLSNSRSLSNHWPQKGRLQPPPSVHNKTNFELKEKHYD